MIGLLALALGGVIAIAAMKKAPTSDGGRDAIRALRKGDDAALRRAAKKWEAVGDTSTAATLQLLADRMANAKKGTPQAASPTVDPDATGSPGIGELVARLAGLETRLMNLVGWANAFGAESLPLTAAMLQAKAVNLQTALGGQVR